MNYNDTLQSTRFKIKKILLDKNNLDLLIKLHNFLKENGEEDL